MSKQEQATDPRAAVRALTNLARQLQEPLNLDQILQHIVETAAAILNVDRASFRLLDPKRTELMAVARAGSPLHENPNTPFAVGEGLMGWITREGQALRTGDASVDPRYAQRPGQKGPLRSFLGVPVMSGEACLGVLSAVSPEPDLFGAGDEELLTLLATISAPHVEVARLSRLYNVDALTGALNRRGLDEILPGGTVAAPLSLVMIDVDHFKKVNDRFGHALGDEVLKFVAGILAGVIRNGDAVVRYGGEEFLLILSAVSLQKAARIAERAREAVAQGRIPITDVEVAVTISAGVAEMQSGESREDLIKRADAAMYEAKEAGRNRVLLASPSTPG